MRTRPLLCSRWRDERLARMHRRAEPRPRRWRASRARGEDRSQHCCLTFRGRGRGRCRRAIRQLAPRRHGRFYDLLTSAKVGFGRAGAASYRRSVSCVPPVRLMQPGYPSLTIILAPTVSVACQGRQSMQRLIDHPFRHLSTQVCPREWARLELDVLTSLAAGRQQQPTCTALEGALKSMHRRICDRSCPCRLRSVSPVCFSPGTDLAISVPLLDLLAWASRASTATSVACKIRRRLHRSDSVGPESRWPLRATASYRA